MYTYEAESSGCVSGLVEGAGVLYRIFDILYLVDFLCALYICARDILCLVHFRFLGIQSNRLRMLLFSPTCAGPCTGKNFNLYQKCA